MLNYRPARQNTQPLSLPAATGGINGAVSLATMEATDCIYTFNLQPTELGMQTRPGFRTHAENIPATLDGILTIVRYDGLVNGTQVSKLFAFSNRGIHDITAASQAPAELYVWPDRSTQAGYVSHAVYTNIAAVTYLIVADWVNGLMEYDPVGDSWAPKTDITGVDPATLTQVKTHQGRLWFVERASSNAWYLPPNVKSGEATRFPLGGTLKRGGELAGLYSWSREGGEGLDDMLIVVGRQGDVIVYEGTDPEQVVSWGKVAEHNIGQVPPGNRLAVEHDADFYILCQRGLLSLQDLIRGNVANAIKQSPARKIEALVRNQMAHYGDELGWEVTLIPANNALMILAPWIPGRTTYPLQFVMTLSTGAWGVARGLDMRTITEYKRQIYWGDMQQGRVYLQIDGPDGVAFDGTGGVPVQFSMLSSYNGLDSPATWKSIQMIRGRYLSDATPAVQFKGFYDYDLSAVVEVPAVQEPAGALWDVSLWDQGVWVADPYSQRTISGTCGVGHLVAVAVRGQTTQRVTYLQADLLVEPGQGYI